MLWSWNKKLMLVGSLIYYVFIVYNELHSYYIFVTFIYSMLISASKMQMQ